MPPQLRHAAPPSRSGRPSRALASARATPSGASLALVGLVAVVALVAAACSPLANLPLPSLAAGGGLTPSATASPRPVPPVSAGASGAAPGSAAQQALAVMDAAKAWAADADRSYKVTFDGTLRYATGTIAVKGSTLVDGTDALTRARFAVPGEAVTIEYRRVDGDDWFRWVGDGWRSVKGIPAADMVDPFRGLRDGSAVAWLGPVAGEEDRFTIRTSGHYLHPLLIPATRISDEKIKSGKLTLVVDGDGRPVRATWNMKGNVRVQGRQVQGVAFDLDLTYSRFGDEFDIEAP
jgi:hypothetical protein